MKLKIGSDFSGIGAFDYAMKRVAEAKGFEIENVFACDMDKFARISYLANHGNPDYYPANVYEREIPNESLDVYMTSPPCQAFSLAGMRKGKDDKRGILFFNSYEFIQKNKPRFFIFENVKGLMSDDNGKTFSEWINLLAGKSINVQPVLFPYDDCVPYHVYYDVMNAKEHGIPQNRERVFIIGIRDDIDNDFRFPKTEFMKNKLCDLLDENVSKKYYLNDKQIHHLLNQNYNQGRDALQLNEYCRTLLSRDYKYPKCIKLKSNPNQIRKLTPREYLRLMDFPDEFNIIVSDSQMYKQAGNSIVVRVLEKILSNLKLINK